MCYKLQEDWGLGWEWGRKGTEVNGGGARNPEQRGEAVRFYRARLACAPVVAVLPTSDVCPFLGCPIPQLLTAFKDSVPSLDMGPRKWDRSQGLPPVGLPRRTAVPDHPSTRIGSGAGAQQGEQSSLQFRGREVGCQCLNPPPPTPALGPASPSS